MQLTIKVIYYTKISFFYLVSARKQTIFEIQIIFDEIFIFLQ